MVDQTEESVHSILTVGVKSRDTAVKASILADSSLRKRISCEATAKNTEHSQGSSGDFFFIVSPLNFTVSVGLCVGL